MSNVTGLRVTDKIEDGIWVHYKDPRTKEGAPLFENGEDGKDDPDKPVRQKFYGFDSKRDKDWVEKNKGTEPPGGMAMDPETKLIRIDTKYMQSNWSKRRLANLLKETEWCPGPDGSPMEMPDSATKREGLMMRFWEDYPFFYAQAYTEVSELLNFTAESLDDS